MQQYFIVTGRQLEPLPPKPVLSDFYVQSEDHHDHELGFLHYQWLEQEPFCGTLIIKIIYHIIICPFMFETIWKIG